MTSATSAAAAATAKMTSATSAAAAAMECQRTGRHRRRADRDGSSERKNLPPHGSLSFCVRSRPALQNPTCHPGRLKIYTCARAGTNYKSLMNGRESRDLRGFRHAHQRLTDF
jgi:hypothetical protein